MKRMILIKEVQYSNHAKTVLGMVKITQVTTTKMVTIRTVRVLPICGVRVAEEVQARAGAMIICTLTRGSLGEVVVCPELDQDVEE